MKASFSGCYGESLPLDYQPEHEQLVSLGWVLAFCHVRGGGEKGRNWYHGGRGRNKMNTFQAGVSSISLATLLSFGDYILYSHACY